MGCMRPLTLLYGVGWTEGRCGIGNCGRRRCLRPYGGISVLLMDLFCNFSGFVSLVRTASAVACLESSVDVCRQKSISAEHAV